MDSRTVFGQAWQETVREVSIQCNQNERYNKDVTIIKHITKVKNTKGKIIIKNQKEGTPFQNYTVMERQLITQIKKDPNYPFVDRVLQRNNPHKRKSTPIRDIIDNVKPDLNNNIQIENKKQLKTPLNTRKSKIKLNSTKHSMKYYHL